MPRTLLSCQGELAPAAAILTPIKYLRAFFLAPTSAINLAVFRIAVFAALTRFGGSTWWYASLPADLLFPPPGWENIAPHLLAGATAGRWIGIVFRIATYCAMLGLATRVSTVVSAVLGLYVLGLPQFFGKIDHWHHLVWFAILLACSPCGARLSIDALLTRRESKPEVVSAFPLRVAWLLIGFVYFFPGWAKLWNVAGGWITGDYMKLLLHTIWSQRGSEFTPLFRLDQWPLLYRTAGLLTIVFELSFIFLVLHRRTRPLALAAGIAFHLGIYLFMGINFWTLLICYVVFVDWSFLTRRKGDVPLGARRPSISALAAGIVLLVTNFLFGVHAIDNWPFAIYPTFAYRPSASRTTLSLELVDAAGQPIAAGTERTLEKRLGNPRMHHLLSHIASAGDRDRERRLKALLQALRNSGAPVHRAAMVRIYRDELSTSPERRHAPLIRRTKLAELPAVR